MRFTIRDLMWATVVVALAVGWWADRYRIAVRHAQIVEWSDVLTREDAQLREWRRELNSRAASESQTSN